MIEIYFRTVLHFVLFDLAVKPFGNSLIELRIPTILQHTNIYSLQLQYRGIKKNKESFLSLRGKMATLPLS